MKHLALLLFGFLALGPLSAQAQSTCVQDFSCFCDFTDASTVHSEATSASQCLSACGEDALFFESTGDISFGTYDFSCRDADGNAVSESGSVGSPPPELEEVPLPAEPLRDPIIPILNVPIPGLDFSGGTTYDPETGVITSNILGLYVVAIYRYLIGAAAIIGVTLLTIAGVQYATAGGSQEKVAKAKDRVKNAIIGMVILLLVYNIAFLIDPRTVKFDSLALRSIEGVELIPPGGEDDNVRATVPLDGSTVPLEGEHIIPPNGAALDPETLEALQAAADDFYNTYGENILITSAARSIEKQASLFYNNCIATGGTCSVPTCNPAGNSSPVINRSGGRYNLTGVLAGGGSPSVIVNTIASYGEHENCPHTSAVAIDAWCEDSGSYQTDPACQAALAEVMTSNGFCRLTSEVWHFELNSKKVSTACSTSNSNSIYTTGSGTFSPGSNCAKWDFKYHRCVLTK